MSSSYDNFDFREVIRSGVKVRISPGKRNADITMFKTTDRILSAPLIQNSFKLEYDIKKGELITNMS